MMTKPTPDELFVTYRDAVAPAKKVYREAVGPLLAAYEAAWDAYEKVNTPAWAALSAVIDPAWATFVEAMKANGYELTSQASETKET